MTKTTDFTKIFQDMFAGLPTGGNAFQDAFKSQAAYAEKFAKVSLEAAEKSADLSAKWTKETLSRLSSVTAAKADPAEYSKALTEFASSAADIVAENLAAFAEIAKKAQSDTVELLLAAGRDASSETAAAVKKATADVTAAAKKASAAAQA